MRIVPLTGGGDVFRALLRGRCAAALHAAARRPRPQRQRRRGGLLSASRPGWRRPGGARPGDRRRAVPGLDPLRAAAGARGRHGIVITLPRPGARAGRSAPRASRSRDDPGLRGRARRRHPRAHRRTGTCCSGSSSRTSTTGARPAPSRRRPGRPMRIGMVCPYSFDVPGGVQFHVRDLAEHLIAPGPRGERARARRRRHPAAGATSWPPAGGARPLQRLRRPAELRSADRRPRRPLARARAGSTSLHIHEPLDPERLAAGAVGGGGAGRRDLPHRQPALAGHAGRLPAAAPGPGEDQRPHRRLRGRPAHRHQPPRRRRRASSPTASSSTGSPRRVPRAQWRGTPRRRRSRSSAGSTSRARACRCCPAALPQVLAAFPGCACSSSATVTRTRRGRGWHREVSAACEFLGMVSEEDKAALLPRSTSTSPRTPAARASASCWSRP